MLVCNDPPFVYLSPPKTGTRAICQLLMDKFPESFVPKDERHSIYPGHITKDKFIILSVRNPFRIAVSWWKHYQHHPLPENRSLAYQKKRKAAKAAANDMPFRDWCLHPGWAKPMTFRKWHISHAIGSVDHIDAWIQQESLEADLKEKVPFLPKDIELFQIGNSEYDQPWWSHYDEKSEVYIRNLYRKDFAALKLFYSDDLQDYVIQDYPEE